MTNFAFLMQITRKFSRFRFDSDPPSEWNRFSVLAGRLPPPAFQLDLELENAADLDLVGMD